MIWWLSRGVRRGEAEWKLTQQFVRIGLLFCDTVELQSGRCDKFVQNDGRKLKLYIIFFVSSLFRTIQENKIIALNTHVFCASVVAQTSNAVSVISKTVSEQSPKKKVAMKINKMCPHIVSRAFLLFTAVAAADGQHCTASTPLCT